jgi:subtilisin family serine protease
MKNIIKTALLFSAIILFWIFGCKKNDSVIPNENINNQTVTTEEFKTSEPIPGQYIIVYQKNYAAQIKAQFKQGMSYREKERYMVAQNAGFASVFSVPADAILFNYHSSITGFAANLNSNALAGIKADPRVAYVEQDQTISLGKPGGGGSPNPVKLIPTGINRVGGTSTTTHIAWIIDTGIDSLHPDMTTHCGYVGSAWKGISFITKGINPHSSFDQDGHGTHVSGTISGIGTGVYGVVPGAEVIPVRVLDANGSGTNAGVIKGVDYVGANASAGDVANMSLGGSYSKALNDAVIAASSNGVFFSIAAGNSKKSYLNYSPASAIGPYIYTVTAMSTSWNSVTLKWTDTWASFSNYGDAQTGGNIVYCDPGVNVTSDLAGTLGTTYSGGSYATWSGTSMATPHVTGILLAKGMVTGNGTVSGDRDGNPDPVGHE